MNTTKEVIAICQAAVRGEPIQWQSRFGDRTWHDKLDGAAPPWDFETRTFRVKPKPREWWLVETRRDIDPVTGNAMRDWMVCLDGEVAQAFAGELLEVVRVREVVA